MKYTKLKLNQAGSSEDFELKVNITSRTQWPRSGDPAGFDCSAVFPFSLSDDSTELSMRFMNPDTSLSLAPAHAQNTSKKGNE